MPSLPCDVQSPRRPGWDRGRLTRAPIAAAGSVRVAPALLQAPPHRRTIDCSPDSGAEAPDWLDRTPLSVTLISYNRDDERDKAPRPRGRVGPGTGDARRNAPRRPAGPESGHDSGGRPRAQRPGSLQAAFFWPKQFQEEEVTPQYQRPNGGEAAAMRIREVEAWVIRSPFPSIDIGGGHSVHMVPESVLVRISTEDGHVGFGDSWIQQSDAAILRSGVLYGLRPLLLGADARQIASLWALLWKSTRNFGLHPALSAVDIALWDLKGRALGAPLVQLFGGLARVRVDAYATIPWHRPEEEQVRLIAAARERGFHGVKIAIGHGVDEDRARIAAIRAAHPTTPFAVDSNGGYDVTDALRVGQACDEHDVRWFEEPVPYTDVAGLAAVAARLRTPISGFQSDTTTYALRRYLDADALSIYQPSLDKCGGITQGLRIAAVLDAWGRRFVPHSAAPPLSFMAALHVSATAPTGGLMEFFVPEREPADSGRYSMAPHLQDPSPLHLTPDGFLQVPEAPGLGVEVDIEAVREHARPL